MTFENKCEQNEKLNHLQTKSSKKQFFFYGDANRVYEDVES